MNSKISNIVFKSLPIIFLLSVTACGTAHITSSRLSNYRGQPHKILFVAKYPDFYDHDGIPSSIENHLRTSLAACGVDAIADHVTDLSFGNPVVEGIRKYNPDALVTSQWTSVLASGNGFAENTEFSLQLTDLHLKKVVWKAKLDLVYGQKDSGELFSNSLINNLVQNGIFPVGCQIVDNK